MYSDTHLSINIVVKQIMNEFLFMSESIHLNAGLQSMTKAISANVVPPGFQTFVIAVAKNAFFFVNFSLKLCHICSILKAFCDIVMVDENCKKFAM